jgi:hypothetical protein
MNSYENEIMNLLTGETPRQKYDYLVEVLKMLNENNDGVEAALLSVCDNLDKKGNDMFKSSGNESYVERCHNHDAKILIYGLTNKSKIEKMTYIKWREEVQSKRS